MKDQNPLVLIRGLHQLANLVEESGWSWIHLVFGLDKKDYLVGDYGKSSNTSSSMTLRNASDYSYYAEEQFQEYCLEFAFFLKQKLPIYPMSNFFFLIQYNLLFYLVVLV